MALLNRPSILPHLVSTASAAASMDARSNMSDIADIATRLSAFISYPVSGSWKHLMSGGERVVTRSSPDAGDLHLLIQKRFAANMRRVSVSKH